MVPIKQVSQTKDYADFNLVDAISGKWTHLVIYQLAHRAIRHSELKRSIDGISQKMLTQTLRNLERTGIVGRTVYPVIPPRVEYSLTSLGESLAPYWARQHQHEAEQARQRFDAR